MKQGVAYQVDLLFNTGDNNEPGSLHVQVMSPSKEKRLSAVIEADPVVSIRNNIDAIIEVMQKDIFNRIKTDIKNELNLYFVLSDSQKAEFNGSSIVKLLYGEAGYQFESVEEISC